MNYLFHFKGILRSSDFERARCGVLMD